jgi:hypothetical protein
LWVQNADRTNGYAGASTPGRARRGHSQAALSRKKDLTKFLNPS